MARARPSKRECVSCRRKPGNTAIGSTSEYLNIRCDCRGLRVVAAIVSEQKTAPLGAAIGIRNLQAMLQVASSELVFAPLLLPTLFCLSLTPQNSGA